MFPEPFQRLPPPSAALNWRTTTSRISADGNTDRMVTRVCPSPASSNVTAATNETPDLSSSPPQWANTSRSGRTTSLYTAAGPGGGPHVRAFRDGNGSAWYSGYGFDPAFHGGVYVG